MVDGYNSGDVSEDECRDATVLVSVCVSEAMAMDLSTCSGESLWAAGFLGQQEQDAEDSHCGGHQGKTYCILKLSLMPFNPDCIQIAF